MSLRFPDKYGLRKKGNSSCQCWSVQKKGLEKNMPIGSNTSHLWFEKGEVGIWQGKQ